MQTQPVGEPGEIVENPDDMRHLQTGPVVKSQRPQRLPIVWRHPGWGRTEFFRDRTEGLLALRQSFDCSPAPLLDRLRQNWTATLKTQKLCVMLCSVRTILGCRRHGGDHFALGTRQGARAEEHDAAQGRRWLGRCGHGLGSDGPCVESHLP